MALLRCLPSSTVLTQKKVPRPCLSHAVTKLATWSPSRACGCDEVMDPVAFVAEGGQKDRSFGVAKHGLDEVGRIDGKRDDRCRFGDRRIHRSTARMPVSML